MIHLQYTKFFLSLSTNYFVWTIFECINISFYLSFYDSIVFVLDCNQPILIGDGYCNDEVNILDCGYDGGDCCLSLVITDYCTNCTCHLLETCAAGFLPPSVGDGFCNDDTNTQQCNFDGGDCCVNVNTDFCSNCSCSGSGVITSPWFPGNYDNNLDLTWLIQLPHGQLIEIVFISFDVESGYVFF